MFYSYSIVPILLTGVPRFLHNCYVQYSACVLILEVWKLLWAVVYPLSPCNGIIGRNLGLLLRITNVCVIYLAFQVVAIHGMRRVVAFGEVVWSKML